MNEKLTRTLQSLVVIGLAGGLVLAQEPADPEPQRRAKPRNQFQLKKVDEATRKRLLGEVEERNQADQIPAPEDVAAPPDDALRTDSGLAYKVLVDGWGDEPALGNDLIDVHFTGWTTDGSMFETTLSDSQARRVQVNRISTGLREAISLMVVGHKIRAWIPDGGVKPAPGTDGPGQVVYEIELLDIQRAPEMPDLAIPEDAIRTEMDYHYKVLQSGRGIERPVLEDRVTFHFDAWDEHGVMVGSSTRVDSPDTLVLAHGEEVFADTMLQMLPGEVRRVWMSEEMARQFVGRRARGTVLFDFEMVSFFRRPETPPDLNRIPADALRTESGIRSKILIPGIGDERPAIGNLVIVDYSAWDEDGNLLDSSFDLGKSAGVILDDTMPAGWNEMIRAMARGEKRRIWMPEKLGFQRGDNTPDGLMVMDVQLVAFMDSGEEK